MLDEVQKFTLVIIATVNKGPVQELYVSTLFENACFSIF